MGDFKQGDTVRVEFEGRVTNSMDTVVVVDYEANDCAVRSVINAAVCTLARPRLTAGDILDENSTEPPTGTVPIPVPAGVTHRTLFSSYPCACIQPPPAEGSAHDHL